MRCKRSFDGRATAGKSPFDFGDIRPRETVFTHSNLWLAATVSSVVELRGDLFADNLPEPIQCSLEVRFRVEQRRMERDDALPYLRQ